MSEADEKRHSDPLRVFLKRGAARMALSAGFEGAHNDALETVVELYASLLQSIAETSKNYTGTQRFQTNFPI